MCTKHYLSKLCLASLVSLLPLVPAFGRESSSPSVSEVTAGKTAAGGTEEDIPLAPSNGGVGVKTAPATASPAGGGAEEMPKESFSSTAAKTGGGGNKGGGGNLSAPHTLTGATSGGGHKGYGITAGGGGNKGGGGGSKGVVVTKSQDMGSPSLTTRKAGGNESGLSIMKTRDMSSPAMLMSRKAGGNPVTIAPPTGGGSTGHGANGATLVMPALMKAKEKANQTKAASPGSHTGSTSVTHTVPATITHQGR